MSRKRVEYLDLARGLAVFFMVMQHTVIVHARGAGEGDGLLGNVLLLLGTAPAAPVFMFIMGVFIMKAQSSAMILARRGVVLFVLGYVLNLFRFTLPLGLAELLGATLTPEQSPGYLFWEVDILQLAGLSFMVAALLRPWATSRWVFPILILVLLLGSPLLWGRLESIPLFAPLWGTEGFVSFPFFPWIVYPLFGMYLSRALFAWEEKGNTTRWMVCAGGALVLGGLLTYEYFVPGDYHRSGAGVHVGMMGFILLWLTSCRAVANRCNTSNVLFRMVFFWSRYVTGIYFIQWILFGWSMLLLDSNAMGDNAAALTGLIVLAISHALMALKSAQDLFNRV
jgi:surface polysaccharide O-acyltransferase-like enzyme